MQIITTAPPPLRDILAEAAELRRRGDHGAAHALDLVALLALRGIVAAAKGTQA